MAVWYVDPEGGNPGANGTTYNDRVLNFSNISNSYASGDEIRYPETPKGLLGAAYWESIESPFWSYTFAHRAGGGVYATSINNVNTNTWTWTTSNTHGFSTGDHFFYPNASTPLLKAVYKVSNVLSSTQFQTYHPIPLSTYSSFGSQGGYLVWANNKVVRFPTGTSGSYTTPLMFCGPYDRSWNAYNNNSVSINYTETSGNNGYSKGAGQASLYVTINNNTGWICWTNLYSPVTLGDKTTLNWWFNPSSNGYVRYWTQNGYNGYGSGQKSFRLYTGSGLSGQYVEYFFPWHNNFNSRWIPCVANVYNPYGLNLNTQQFYSIAIQNNGAYGTENFYVTNLFFSKPRFAAEGSSWLSNTSNLNNGATSSSLNLHALIGHNGNFTLSADSEVYWPIDSITENGDVIIGACTTYQHPVINQNASTYNSETRGYINSTLGDINESLSVEYRNTYVQQMLRKDPYNLGAEAWPRSQSNITYSGGWLRGTSMQTKGATSMTFIDGQVSNYSFIDFYSSYYNYNYTFEDFGITRFNYGVNQQGVLNAQLTLDNILSCGNQTGIFISSYNIYTTGTGDGQLNPPGGQVASNNKNYVAKLNNVKGIANLVNGCALGASTSSSHNPRHYVISGNYNIFSSNRQYGLSINCIDRIFNDNNAVESIVYAKNNRLYGLYNANNGTISIDRLHATQNFERDIVSYNTSRINIEYLYSGVRSWNNNTSYPKNIADGFSFFYDSPILFQGNVQVNIEELQLVSRYIAQPVEIGWSNVGISTISWSMTGIDYNMTKPVDFNTTHGPDTMMSTQYLRQNGTRRGGWIWKNPYGWMEENPDGLNYAYNNTGTSWKITTGGATTTENPSSYPIGRVAVDGTSPITISCKYYNLDSKNAIALHVPRSSCGILTDLYSTSSVGVATGTWQDLDLSFYPTKPGVLDVFVNSWNLNAPNLYVGQSFYIDAFSFS